MENKINNDKSSNAKYRDINEQNREAGNEKGKEEFKEQEYKEENDIYTILEDKEKPIDIDSEDELDYKKKGYKKGIFRGLIKKLENFLKWVAHKTKIEGLLNYIKKLGIIISLQMLLDNINKSLAEKLSIEKLSNIRKVKKAKRTKGSGKNSNSAESEKEADSLKDKEKNSAEHDKDSLKDREKERDKATEEQKSREKSSAEEKNKSLSPATSQELDSFNKSNSQVLQSNHSINSGNNIAYPHISEQFKGHNSSSQDITKSIFNYPGSNANSGSASGIANAMLNIAKDLGAGISNAVNQASNIIQQGGQGLYENYLNIKTPSVKSDGSINNGVVINILVDENGIADISFDKSLKMNTKNSDFRSQVKEEKSFDKSFVNKNPGSGIGF